MNRQQITRTSPRRAKPPRHPPGYTSGSENIGRRPRALFDRDELRLIAAALAHHRPLASASQALIAKVSREIQRRDDA